MTLTGEPDNAQAIIVSSYLEQTWPETGPHLLKLLDETLRTDRRTASRAFAGVVITASEFETHVEFVVEGVRAVVVEIGEQLCWLSSALRNVPEKPALFYSTPKILVTTPKEADTSDETEYQVQRSYTESLARAQLLIGCHSAKFRIKIEFTHFEPDCDELGTCWHGMFGNIAMVKGFPILRRAQSIPGLDIPLDIVGDLLGTKYVSRFHKASYIRGLSAMLCPAKEVDDLAIRHLKVAQQGKETSFEDVQKYPYRFGKPIQAYARHIVGWSNRARHNVSSLNCNYNILRSKARKVSATDALYGCVISPFEPIPSEQTFQILKDQYPGFHGLEELPRIMRRLSSRFVCLWDDSDQRAWLTDGVSALAHLVRASIESDGEQTPQFLALEANQLEEPSEACSYKSSGEFLCNANNQNLAILRYPHKGGVKIETFEDRVNQFYYVLDSAFAYCKERRKLIKSTPRGILEGWHFRDLVWRRDDSHRAYRFSVGYGGRGWADMLREARVLTLSGSGFGNLFEPIPEEGKWLCSDWMSLPTQGSYMASVWGWNERPSRSTHKIFELDSPCRTIRVLWLSKGVSSNEPCSGNLANKAIEQRREHVPKVNGTSQPQQRCDLWSQRPS